MFKEMRRKKQLLSLEETEEILRVCTSGVLGVIGDDDYPYTIPLSYAFKDGKIFFHCAKEGHKLDAIKRNDKVTFCVIEKDQVVQEEFTTRYRSVSIFGRARVLMNDSERRYALECLVEKYSPDYIKEGKQEIESQLDHVCLVEIQVEHMTGKASTALLRSSS
ncbi:MAG TPA: 5-nitroimidazole antibiotic resistance protein [Ruminiclostridium sp.]|nr:5-nitroimidazole antibiotic resistance protein [Ruminiclostridium sp.]